VTATPKQTPLAWHNLAHDARRFAVSLAGISFAVVLIFMEFGFRNALLDSMVAVINALDADVFVLSKSRYSVIIPAGFNRRRLDEAMGCRGVVSAVPLYLESHVSMLRDARGRRTRKVRVMAFDPDQPVFRLSDVRSRRDALKQPDTALIDLESRGIDTGRLSDLDPRLMDRSLRLVGGFHLGVDFVVDGNLIMSDRNFLKYYADPRDPRPELRRADLGLIRLAPGTSADEAARTLRSMLGGDVTVLSRGEMLARERRFWQTRSPIGYVFGLGMVMGFVVGVMICFQILSSGIRSHLAEYATLKAMGYGRRHLLGFVMQESLILAVVGFLPGFLLSLLLYNGLAALTNLPLRHTPGRVGLVLVVSVVMCLCSGLIAVRKLFAADPAELFK
jgi:putative ABC transport system permease protein